MFSNKADIGTPTSLSVAAPPPTAFAKTDCSENRKNAHALFCICCNVFDYIVALPIPLLLAVCVSHSSVSPRFLSLFLSVLLPYQGKSTCRIQRVPVPLPRGQDQPQPGSPLPLPEGDFRGGTRNGHGRRHPHDRRVQRLLAQRVSRRGPACQDTDEAHRGGRGGPRAVGSGHPGEGGGVHAGRRYVLASGERRLRLRVEGVLTSCDMCRGEKRLHAKGLHFCLAF